MVNWRPLWTAGLLVCAAQAVSGQEERWYCGRLEGEACLSAHEVIAPLGSATDTRFELELVVKAPRAVVFREAPSLPVVQASVCRSGVDHLLPRFSSRQSLTLLGVVLLRRPIGT